MSRLATRVVIASALALGVASPFSSAVAQGAKDFVGTWRLVSLTTDQGGNKFEPFGSKPHGMMIFGSDGRYVQLITKADLPKIASNNRTAGTAEENKTIYGGLIGHFGRYTVEEGNKVVVFHS